MRHPLIVTLSLSGALLISACERPGQEEVERAVEAINVIDENGLNDIMLTVADANEAVSYFRKAVQENPGRIDLQRGLATSLIRASRPAEGVIAWQKVVDSGEATNADRVDLADAFIRNNNWKKAGAILDEIPPTYETFDRYRLEAMVADSTKKWKKADSFYEIAVGLTTKPAGVLNNWGYSKLTRGDYPGAERLFSDALSYNPKMFTAKNNLVLARGAQGNYNLPIVEMSQTERAQLLHTMALSAIKQGDVATGKGLLKDAIDTHPQYFEAAVLSLRTLENKVTN